jgi:hypothetical protein
MGWFGRVFGGNGYSVSVDEARSTFLYRERGRRIQVSGETMADGYAVYSASIRAWETGSPNTLPNPVIDDAERLRIASNIRTYFVRRGKNIYLT